MMNSTPATALAPSRGRERALEILRVLRRISAVARSGSTTSGGLTPDPAILDLTPFALPPDARAI